MSAWVLTPVPDALHVRAFLGDLLGRPVEVRAGDPFEGEATPGSTFADYVDAHDCVRAVIVMDLVASASLGAAVGLLPPGAAHDSIQERALTPTLQENVGEVLNVLGGLLNSEDSPHVKLRDIHHVGRWPATEIVEQVALPGRRLDLLVDVAQYGAGRLSVVGVA